MLGRRRVVLVYNIVDPGGFPELAVILRRAAAVSDLDGDNLPDQRFTIGTAAAAALRAALLDAVSEDDLRDIVSVLVSKAKAGILFARHRPAAPAP